jgi:hypothetical protein
MPLNALRRRLHREGSAVDPEAAVSLTKQDVVQKNGVIKMIG